MNRIIITIICFVVGIGLGLIAVWPKYQNYRVLKFEVEQKKTEFGYHQQYFAKLKEISSKLGGYNVALSKIENALPSYFSVPEFMSNLQKLASQSGMILTNISGGKSGEKEGRKEHTFSLALSGDYSNFKNFLSILEKSAKIIEVENFSFSTALAARETTMSFTVNIKTYSY